MDVFRHVWKIDDFRNRFLEDIVKWFVGLKDILNSKHELNIPPKSTNKKGGRDTVP